METCRCIIPVEITNINQKIKLPAGELTRFQAGVTMDISRLDAWYSSKEGSLETPATYIVRGLCRRCCLPELVLRSMQVMPLICN